MYQFPVQDEKQTSLLQDTLYQHSYAIFDVSNHLDCLDDHEQRLLMSWNETFAMAFRQPEDIKLAASKFRMERGISVGYKIEDKRQFMETRSVNHGKSIEPDFPDVPEYTKTVRLLFTVCRLLGKTVLSSLANRLRLDPQSLISLTDLNDDEHGNTADVSMEEATAHPPSPPELSSSLLRICMYPMEETNHINDRDQTDRIQGRVESAFGAHTDTSFLTIGFCSTQPGLEMFNITTGEWIPVEQHLLEQLSRPPQSSKSSLFAVVFLGDCLQALTGGYYRAAPHRVNFSAGLGSGASAGIGNLVPRISCPFIIRGRHDAVINLRDTSLYQHTRLDILLPNDDGDDSKEEQKNASVPTSDDAVVDGVLTDHLGGLRLPNLDGSSMKFLHQVLELKRKRCAKEHADCLDEDWILSAYPITPLASEPMQSSGQGEEKISISPPVLNRLKLFSTIILLFFLLLLGNIESIVLRQTCRRTFRLASSDASDAASSSVSGIKTLLQQQQVISRDTAYLMITTLSASKDWAALDDTINTLRTTHQIEIDIPMWDTIVIGAAKSDPNIGKKYYNKMLKHGPQLSTNMTMYESLLKSYSRVENWKEIAVFYQSMISRQDALMDQVGLGFYEIALSYCARRGRYKEAVFWQEELKRRGLIPSHKAYRLTIDACNKGGKPKLAMSYIDAMLVAFADEGSIDFEMEEKANEGGGDDDS